MTGARHRRWLFALCFAVAWIVLPILRYGFDGVTLLVGVIGLLASLFGESLARRLRVARPWRSYLWAASASALLALLLFRTGFDPIVLLFWVVLTAMALIWAWYWERTEPLPGTL